MKQNVPKYSPASVYVLFDKGKLRLQKAGGWWLCRPRDKAAVLCFLSKPSGVTRAYKHNGQTRKHGAKKCSMHAVKVEGGENEPRTMSSLCMLGRPRKWLPLASPLIFIHMC